MQDPAPNLSLVPAPNPPLDQNRRMNQALLLVARWMSNVFVIGGMETVGLMAAMALAGGVRLWVMGTPMYPDWAWFPVLLWLLAGVGTRSLPGWGLGPVEELRRTTLLVVGVFGASAVAIFLGKVSVEYSRLTLSLSLVFAWVLVPFCRMLGKRILIRLRLWGMQAVVFASDPAAARRLVSSLREEPGLGYVPVAVANGCAHRGEKIDGLPWLDEKELRGVYADVAILAVDERERRRILGDPNGPLRRYRHTVLVTDLDDSHSLWVQTRDLGGVLGLEISHILHDPLAKGLKRLTDYVFVVLLAPVWIPLLLLISLAVLLLDRHAPFFRQTRIGRHHRRFTMWKFRTMHGGADAMLAERLAADEDLRIEWEAHRKLRRDPRVTPLGRFLRVTSLDELPQFINILNGTMSLVGPRPLPEYHDDELPDAIRRMRLSVRPGMTGLWQVSGRSDAGTTGLVKWDSYYVRNWSIWLDIVVLVRTMRVVLTGRGAY